MPPPVRHQSTRPRCGSCDYDLTGTVEEGPGRCPECGDRLDAAGLDRARERHAFRRVRRRLWILGVLAVVLSAATYLLLSDHAVFIAPMVIFVVAPIAPVLLAGAAEERRAPPRGAPDRTDPAV